jgi:hypothetical protein
MMKGYYTTRREFLKLVLSLPLALMGGCKREPVGTALKEASPGPEESLRKLLIHLGPWPPSRREDAEDFAERFLKHASGPYLPGMAGPLQALAGRFREGMRVEGLSLGELPREEQELLMHLVRRLYSLIEVRFAASGEPPWGECQADRMRYTRPPA